MQKSPKSKLRKTKAAETIAAGRFLDVFQGIAGGPAPVRFRCVKSLRLISEAHPILLEPWIEEIVDLLGSDNRILKWNAIAVLGNIAAADRQLLTESLMQAFYRMLSSGELITANHAIAALGKIGHAYPERREEITSQLLKVEQCSFQMEECRNIAIGKVILALEAIGNPAGTDGCFLEFARRQCNNRRSATARKAQSFLRRLTTPGRMQTLLQGR
jgi:hypothetical protein